MGKLAINTVKLTFNKDNFSDFINKFQDLTHIEDIIKFKINKDFILMYSMLATETSVLALKNYSLPTNEYLDDFELEETLDYVICNAAKVVKNLKMFNTDKPVKIDVSYKESPDSDEVMHVRSSNFSNGKLKISVIGGEQHKIRDINKSVLDSRLNPKSSKWGFKISKDDFMDVKKLCSINSSESASDKIVNIDVTNGEVLFSETSKWDMVVSNVEDVKNTQITFNKKYLSNINTDEEHVSFSMFDTFILVKDSNSNLMLSFEQDFEND